jgi:hypothetical protein
VGGALEPPGWAQAASASRRSEAAARRMARM